MPLKNHRSRRMTRRTELARERSSVSGTPIAEFGEASIAALCCRDIVVRPFVTSNFARPFHERHSASCPSPLQKLCQPLRPTVPSSLSSSTKRYLRRGDERRRRSEERRVGKECRGGGARV